jgi:hypothetical protein
MATSATAANPERVRSMIVPREHGAWGMLFIPLLTGAAVALAYGGPLGPLLWFAFAALALFWLRTPVESLIGSSPLRPQNEAERQPVVFAAAGLTLISAATLTALLWGGSRTGLLAVGAAAALAFTAQAALKKAGRRARMAAQMVGVIGLTATAPAAYYSVTGRLDRTALALWLANWVFAAGQIHFVQLRIHAARVISVPDKMRRGRSFLLGQAVMITAICVASAAGVFSWLVPLAFIPAIARSLRWFLRKPQPLAVRALGWWEVAHSLTFGMLLVLAFLL